MNINKLRQQVDQLNKKRGELLRQGLRPGKMVRGSLYEMERECGNPNCKCARGKRHKSWYLSQQVDGRTKLTYIGKTAPVWLIEEVRDYIRYQRVLARIREIDRKISSALNRMRDIMVRNLEELRRRIR